jgi:diguanylate cyclase (GGDEF)-like protein
MRTLGWRVFFSCRLPISLWHAIGAVTLVLCYTAAIAANNINQLLSKADSVKSSNPVEFAALLNSLDSLSNTASLEQRRYINFLKGWQAAYRGDYSAAIPVLKALLTESADPTLQFRARATMVNVLAIATQYEDAFFELNRLVDQLPTITDGNAREQALFAATVLYNRVGQYDLATNFAEMMIAENWQGRGQCKGGQLKLEALEESNRLGEALPEVQRTIDACIQLQEMLYANFVRVYLARWYAQQGRFADTIKIIAEHYEEAKKTKYPPLISAFEILLAYGYRDAGDVVAAKQFALRATESAVKNQYTEPLINAYRLLYALAKQQGDAKAALMYLEKYATADKGYLDDVSARQLAYQRVNQETLANKLQIDTLNKQNEVLKLKQDLADKAVETSRLYIVILTMVLIFIALFAYRTKLSQVHFRKLSRLDGLTEIFNRPHFIDQAQRALDDALKVNEDTCVILCDLDHFKSINDKFGHAGGDFVLKQAVAVFRKHLRANDIVGRLGGEEFGILLPGCDLVAARERCELIRTAFAEIVIPDGDPKSKVSASFGVAVTRHSGYELRQLLIHADKALYHAKSSGRNLVALYDTANDQKPPVVSNADQSIRGVA